MSNIKSKLICLLLSFIYMLLMLAVIAVPERFHEKVSYNVFNVSHAIYLFVIFLILIIYTLIAQKKNWIFIHKKRDKIINYIFLGLTSALIIIDIIIDLIAMIVAGKAIVGLLNFLVCFVLIEILCFTLISTIHVRRSNTSFTMSNKIGTKYIGFCLSLTLIYTGSFFAMDFDIGSTLSFIYSIKSFVIYFIWFVYNVCIERNNLDLIYRKEKTIVNIVFVCLTTILTFVDIVLEMVALKSAIENHRKFYINMYCLLIISLLTLIILSITNTITIAKKSK